MWADIPLGRVRGERNKLSNSGMADSVERNMFYGAKPHIFQKAKTLRENMTEAEKVLWAKVSNKQLGYRFKAQHPIDIFIADFYCHELRLVVEVDGGIHDEVDQIAYDEGRTNELEGFGIKVIRFTNQEVNFQLDKVLAQLSNICEERKLELD